MTLGLIRGLLTATLFFAFIALWIWAWSKRREPEFKAAAMLALTNDEPVNTRSDAS
jgi:cytochrome c oxidase cbb3-type subunit 4